MGSGAESLSILNFSMFFLFIFSLLPSHFYCAEVEVYNITPSQPLAHGQILVSYGRIFELGFFSPNGSANKYVGLWHRNVLPHKVVWVANRENPLAVEDTLATLRVSSNGNLELIDGKQIPVWSTSTTFQVTSSNTSSVAAYLLDTGNFVVKYSGNLLWESFDYPADTILQGQLLGFDSKSGTKNVMTSWKSESDPSTGKYLVGLTPETPSQVFIWINGSIPHWRSGPWDRSKFIGIPDMDDRYGSGFSLLENLTAKYFSYSFSDSSLAYLDISSEGISKLMLSESGKNWYPNFTAPNNPCDNYGACGPFGICKAFESSMCKCLKGFVPKSDEDWSKGNWTGGCVRQNKLYCQRNKSKSFSLRTTEDDDWFKKMTMLKVPDSHEFVVTSLDVDNTHGACERRCLNNCSCLAYAFVNKIGCLVWSKDLIDIQQFSFGGEDLYIRLAEAEQGEGKPIKLITTLTAICSITILGAIVYGWHRLGADRKGKHLELTDSILSSRDALRGYIGRSDLSELLIYDFDIISTATNNFNITNKLGQGGFGPVYKGLLPDGKEIAVKRLSSSSGQGIQEFKNEMLFISNLQHKNLVRLLGCCIKHEEKLLIYEFMANKSLDTFLCDQTRKKVLDWATRFNIIQGVARGLLYLHHDSCLKVVHRDLKVSNILLDDKMIPKISDFGLARVIEATQNLENTRRIVGTIGYMSPEYAMRGLFSEKSDVYSFGVLVLEIISSKKNSSFFIHDQQLGLLSYVWQLWNEGRGLELVDEVFGDSYSPSQVMRCIHIGLLCIQDNAADRPTMHDVICMLNSETDACSKPKQPAYTFQNSVSQFKPHDVDTRSTNDVATITVMEGR
ncbi:putative protein kinase RLK-Pelle-DLSV family [Rosa chinensis]|uniref:Receptor-like serine/threonine-protein kinase n=1 Tax=Rosa chinensis TaxID=74649 RepID=A0A2P6S2F9_ROSCH|nr:G-type lectin S-receptor-like serine/threonine-protein kinase At1g61500 [Rosa chinensis]PRQ52859.1 putative protein kinase RLK-Pelle-DLSV family [Rosa chinensis]